MGAQPAKSIADTLKHQWCDAFDLIPIDSNRWSVVTPFLFPDGDGYSVILERVGGSWFINDYGATESRVFAEPGSWTESRFERLQVTLSLFGLDVKDHQISMRLDSDPDPFEIARYLKGLISAHNAALPAERAAQEAYTRKLRSVVIDHLDQSVTSKKDWTAVEDRRRLYKTDLRLLTPEEPWSLFLIGNETKAERAVTVANKLREWGELGRALIAVRPGLNSSSVYRLQDAVGEDAVKEVDASNDRRALSVLGQAGVPVAA